MDDLNATLQAELTDAQTELAYWQQEDQNFHTVQTTQQIQFWTARVAALQSLINNPNAANLINQGILNQQNYGQYITQGQNSILSSLNNASNFLQQYQQPSVSK